MENLNNEWKTLADVQAFRTNDPQKMRGMYLAAPMVKSWTEDFIGEDTNETVSIERNEIIKPRGIKLTDHEISSVMFSIQAEEVEDVLVCAANITGQRFISGRMVPCEVSIFNNMEKKTYLVRANSVESAIECLRNYAPLYLELKGDYSVIGAKNVAYTIVEDDNEAVEQNPDEEISFAEFNYYKVNARLYEYNEDKQKMDKTNYTIIIKAQDVSEAKNRSMAWMKDVCSEELEDPQNSVVILKANPYATAGIVPLSYCEMFKEKETI